ncbi:MAG: beta-N-acetylhexosaminidase [Spirochaetaceae bacterium]|nr:beta-N-acetylhexosaminidase [Spirochaetaceae bacterium]
MPINDKINIIPQVSELLINDSKYTLTENSSISVSSEKILEKGELLRSYLIKATGFEIPLKVNSNSDIILKLEGDSQRGEAYTINIKEKQCVLQSGTVEGIARTIQTFRQLLPSEIFSAKALPSKKWTIPGCQIKDSPRFFWRGMHLDVCRHFMTKEEVCRFIDLIALYKYNRVHLHLTEDQGWRIEIKKYPKLTEVGSVRESTIIGHVSNKPKHYDGKIHKGFYTQDDIKEIVEFASKREISIIPEIDMPGHMQAAIAAYPELGCTDMTVKPLCHWGISQHILNVEESTINFMKDVLDEVLALFPGKYIHLGGDEAPKFEWEEQRRIQDRMIELGLKSEDELQSWFIKKMSSHIQSKGRKVIGWDEILEGGLAEGAAVMSWRGEEGGIEAAALGHDVVMTPQSHVYFDHYQGDEKTEPLTIGGFTPLAKVYSYEPIPENMPLEQHNHVLGSQGQLWTEYMPDFNQVEYMMFPRACALSEVLWINKENKNYHQFLQRLKENKHRLDLMNVNYCKLE